MVNATNQFTQESFLLSKQKGEIHHFWSEGHFSYFKGIGNIRINYAKFINPLHTRNLVIVPGRAEGYLKYKELAFDLFRQGFNIFIIDHRGQGISERLLENSHKGYVQSFEHYVEDLNTFIIDVVNQTPLALTQGIKPYLLAHSMGASITIRLMQRSPDLIQASVLSSPMIRINLGKIPQWLANIIVSSAEVINQLIDDQSWYLIGQGDYKITPFEENKLTHSSVRYQHFVEEYQSNKYIQLGGVTYHWLKEAFKTQKLIFKDIKKLSKPILILQASKDSIVNNNAHNVFCELVNKNKMGLCETFSLKGAKHEVLFETDLYRNQALQKCLAWIEAHPLKNVN